MHSLMVGMFWGGLVMALPPVAIGVAVVVFILRKQRQPTGDEHEAT